MLVYLASSNFVKIYHTSSHALLPSYAHSGPSNRVSRYVKIPSKPTLFWPISWVKNIIFWHVINKKNYVWVGYQRLGNMRNFHFRHGYKKSWMNSSTVESQREILQARSNSGDSRGILYDFYLRLDLKISNSEVSFPVIKTQKKRIR